MSIKKNPFNLCHTCYLDLDIIKQYRAGDKQALVDESAEQSVVLMEVPDYDEQGEYHSELKIDANPFIGCHISPLSDIQLDSLLRANFE